MEPLKRIDENTPIGSKVIVVDGFAPDLKVAEFRGIACGWAHVGEKGSEEIYSPLDVFEFPAVQP